MLHDLIAENPSPSVEEGACTEICMGNKFLEELRPAQQRVNVRLETSLAMEEADRMVKERRAKRAAAAAAAAAEAAAVTVSSPPKPEPPSARPPVAPVEDESSEEMTPRMQTRAVVPETTAEKTLPHVAAESVPEPEPPAPRDAVDPPITVSGHAEHVTTQVVDSKTHEVVHVEASAKALAPVVEPVHETPVPAPAAAPAAVVSPPHDDTDSLSTSEDEAHVKAAANTTALVGAIEASQLPSCSVCVKPFNMFRREKQCSECERAVCNQCVGFFRLRSLQDSKPRYICFSCLPAIRSKVIDPSFKGAELVRATREAAAVDLLLAGNLHQHFVSTDFSPNELTDMKNGTLRCARSGDKFDFSRPPRRCTDCNSACTARDCRNFDWVARVLQRPQPSTLCRACWPAVRAELLQKLGQDKETDSRVMDEVEVGDLFFALNREKDFPDPPNVERGQRCFTCTKKFTLFRVPQKCSACSELVCTGVACSGKFLVPALSRTSPSVVCSGCLSKVVISRPPPGQLTSQQDNPLTGVLANAVVSGATCAESGKGFSFWDRPHLCPESGNLVLLEYCKVVDGKIVARSVGQEIKNKPVTTLAEVMNTTGEEELESVSDTETSSVAEDDEKDKASDAKETTSVDAERGAAAVNVGTTNIAASIPDEVVSTTSSTTDDEEVKAAAPAPAAAVVGNNNASSNLKTLKTSSNVAPDVALGTNAPKDTFLTSWYPFLKDLTASTTFVSASGSEILALLQAADPKTAAQANKGDLRTLESKLDRAVEQQGGVVFIKIETRSPKDVLQSTSMMDRLRGLVKPTMRPASGHLSVQDRVEIANADTIAFVKGIRQLFKIKSGAEAIAMLKMSERVKQDLEKSVSLGGALICVRRWRDVDAAREFRAFVFNRKLTACSQYCYYQCFPELLKTKDQLSERIVQFFEKQVLPIFPYKDAVIDFHVTDDFVEIIELSPFAFNTGACMFSWKSETDKAILENGPFELRILTEPKLNPYECLPSKWRQWFESERGFSLRGNGAGAVAVAEGAAGANASGGIPSNSGSTSSASGAAAPAPAPAQAAKPVVPPIGGPAAPVKQVKEEKKKWTFGKAKGKKDFPK